MGLDYTFVIWNRFKKRYDRAIVVGMLLFLLVFIGTSFLLDPLKTPETVLIRAFGALAITMLHVILAIGPLSRLDARFLPLLYNRRHLGVSMFLAALVHGAFAIFQFHALGDIDPVSSIFRSNPDFGSLSGFPFQILGFLALLILFTMAATSHDFFLANLSPRVWKGLHMLVYWAYALLIGHVFLGAFQQEGGGVTPILLGVGFLVLAFLHLRAGGRETRIDRKPAALDEEGWVAVGPVEAIPEDRAKVVRAGDDRIAVFKYEGRLSAIHNFCKHQGGPLGEGKVVDGCVTCPWHGYQYLPGNGQSPPPFTEKVATYRLKLVDGTVYVDPKALPEGTAVEPLTY